MKPENNLSSLDSDGIQIPDREKLVRRLMAAIAEDPSRAATYDSIWDLVHTHSDLQDPFDEDNPEVTVWVSPEGWFRVADHHQGLLPELERDIEIHNRALGKPVEAVGWLEQAWVNDRADKNLERPNPAWRGPPKPFHE